MPTTPHGITFDSHRPVVMGRNGMVCSGHPLASQAGISVLQQGGNAVDAAIATAAALNVVEPMMSGIGGDGFIMVYWKDTGRIDIANGTGAAPYAATLDRYQDGIPMKGVMSVSVPGLVHCWLDAHEKYGVLPLSQVFAPALDLAANGFPATHYLAGAIASDRLLCEFPTSSAVFTKDVSQATWTKVSVSSILTSLYPSSHGIVDTPDRLPSSVTTLAEVFQQAGYATFHTSSVPFTGRMTNLHQGVEVLHEAASIGDLDHSDSKTARTFVDRLLRWLETHRDTPFFAFLHVFVPHSPFEPYGPYDGAYMDDAEAEQHRENLAAAVEIMEPGLMKSQRLPSVETLAEAGIDADIFLDAEMDWYDASIKAMDVEVGRLLEKIDALGRRDDTLIVFMSDHGEEFLEHGHHWHGVTAYGEMLNVPLFFSWPGVIPTRRIDTVVQSIDVYPTLLDLAPVAADGTPRRSDLSRLGPATCFRRACADPQRAIVRGRGRQLRDRRRRLEADSQYRASRRPPGVRAVRLR